LHHFQPRTSHRTTAPGQQGQFVALINAIEMQLDSGDPNPAAVRLLGEALSALADARQIPRTKLKLNERLDTLNKRIASYRIT
jgi:hypothetical protein